MIEYISKNALWSSYWNFENQLQRIAHTIYIDEKQLSTYSNEIGDLFLSITSKIESISRSLYIEHIVPFKIDSGAVKEFNGEKFKFDYDFITEFEKRVNLTRKILILNSNIFHFDDDVVITPFSHALMKKPHRGGDWYYSYDNEDSVVTKVPWLDDYQSLKHNYMDSLSKCGTITNVIHALGALYILMLCSDFYMKRSTVSRNDYDLTDTQVLKSTIFRVECGNPINSDEMLRHFKKCGVDRQNIDMLKSYMFVYLPKKDDYNNAKVAYNMYKHIFKGDCLNTDIRRDIDAIPLSEKLKIMQTSLMLKKSSYQLVLNIDCTDYFELIKENYIEKYKSSKYQNNNSKVFSNLTIGENVKIWTVYEEFYDGLLVKIGDYSLVVSYKGEEFSISREYIQKIKR
ncbi:MAG: hypothetical protein RBQ97_08595 [Acholeplasma sp.]|nr:hypothetical protein [Acholeplasma sp.]